MIHLYIQVYYKQKCLFKPVLYYYWLNHEIESILSESLFNKNVVCTVIFLLGVGFFKTRL